MDQKSGNFETINFFLQEGLENYGEKSEKLSKKSKKNILTKYLFFPNILQNIILTKNIHKWTKKVEISKQLIFFCKRA